MSQPGKRPEFRQAVVGVAWRANRYLVIRRSETVRAPNKICFPGGNIELGEEPVAALLRELDEELGMRVTSYAPIWRSETNWGVRLHWFAVNSDNLDQLQANPQEVAEVLWLTSEEIMARHDLLGSVPGFLGAVRSKEFEMPPASELFISNTLGKLT